MAEFEITEQMELARPRVCHALDYGTVQASLDASAELADLIGTVKVGKSLNQAACNAGIPIMQKINEAGGKVFLDLKLHDTPDQAELSAYQCTVPGVYMFNLHVAGGEQMCEFAMNGAREAAERQGIPVPKVIGVTVLTSLNDAKLKEQGWDHGYAALVKKRTGLAKKWGLDGVVCAAKVAGEMEQEFGEWLYVTPGISFDGVQNVGQEQLDQPAGAVQACKSSILVVGSAIRKAPDRKKAAYGILQAMAPYMEAK